MVIKDSDIVDLKSKETHVIHKEGSRVRQKDTIPPIRRMNKHRIIFAHVHYTAGSHLKTGSV